MKLSELDLKFKEDTDDIAHWCTSVYEDKFKAYFQEVTKLYDRLKCDHKPITDTELETILTSLPLELFSVAEELNILKAKAEAIKFRIKKAKHEAQIFSDATSQIGRKEAAAYAVLEDELLLKAYSMIIERVDSEISFSRELIMSAKKIWTARKQAESIAVAAENVDDSSEKLENLPDYTYMAGKEYIG